MIDDDMLGFWNQLAHLGRLADRLARTSRGRTRWHGDSPLGTAVPTWVEIAFEHHGLTLALVPVPTPIALRRLEPRRVTDETWLCHFVERTVGIAGGTSEPRWTRFGERIPSRCIPGWPVHRCFPREAGASSFAREVPCARESIEGIDLHAWLADGHEGARGLESLLAPRRRQDVLFEDAFTRLTRSARNNKSNSTR
ncbi:MAG: hypothetical protein H6834_10500 [Planctomycetes bacterium]|nr:hypothetical protein [Planctomycetota bacterium]